MDETPQIRSDIDGDRYGPHVHRFELGPDCADCGAWPETRDEWAAHDAQFDRAWSK